MKVRLLLLFAQVEYRPSLVPPISMNSLWSAVTHKAISLNAHSFQAREH